MQKVKWGEFVIKDLFEKVKVNKLAYKASDLPSEPIDDYILPALTAGIQNQGLNNYVPIKNATILQNVISISANGANTGATFYQSHKFTVLQDAYAIKWIHENDLTSNQYLFMASAISKAIYGNYEWTNKAGWERIKTETIKLPITTDGKIDFTFIAEFVAELEAQRVAELETYLQVTGLKDYTLTADEHKCIENFSKISLRKYMIDELFEKVKVKSLKYKTSELPNTATLENPLPALTAGIINQGLNNYVPSQNATILKNVISISANGANTGATFFQSHNFTVLQDAYAIQWKNNEKTLSENSYLYFTGAISKVIYGNYEWTNKAGWERIKFDKISVPIKEGNIDIKYIDTFISALKKLVIKDIVMYADRKISGTKYIINNNRID